MNKRQSITHIKCPLCRKSQSITNNYCPKCGISLQLLTENSHCNDKDHAEGNRRTIEHKEPQLTFELKDRQLTFAKILKMEKRINAKVNKKINELFGSEDPDL